MSFHQEWEEYRANCLIDEPACVQKIARDAFFCGALILSSLTARICRTTTEQSFPEQMQALELEILQACERIAKEVAP